MKKADKSAASRAKNAKSAKPASKAGAARTKSAKPASKAATSTKATKATKVDEKASKASKKAPAKTERRRKSTPVPESQIELEGLPEGQDEEQERQVEAQLEEQIELPLSAAEAGNVTDEGDDGDDDDGDAEDGGAPAALSEEERELSSIYGDDLSAPSMAHVEFKDQKTADEDRPMLPEINARDERRKTWEDRRDRRRQEREARRAARRDRGGRPQERGPHGGGRPEARPEGRPEQRQEHRGQPRPEPRLEGRPERQERSAERPSERPAGPVIAAGQAAPQASWGSPLVSATATLFAQLRNGQPMPVRQLASMLRKRSLIEAEPEQVWPALRAELLADERAHRALGLRPRVVHRGRDLFAPGPSALGSSGELETQLAQSVLAITAATARGLTAWMASASPSAFERLIHTYVVATGYREVEWIKRVDGISYAQAIAPGIDRPVLLSARSGSAPLDRRGVGELRVGVEAKGLPFGTLFAASSLSPDAERELERPGRSIYVVCGEALASALMSAGLGVSRAAVTVNLLDEQFLEDLSALQS